MRMWKIAAAAAVVASAAFGTGAPYAEARTPLKVKRFLTGRLEANTEKFIATGGRGTTNVFRDNVLLFVFSAPVDLNTVNDRTIKIGVPTSGGQFIEAKGSFYPYVVQAFDPISASFQPKRTYRNRVLFDPTSRRDPPDRRNPYGFLSNSTFNVTVPGIDSDTTKTVKTKDGSPNLETYITSFATLDKYLQDYTQPSIVKVEAVDAPNVPLDGRTNVNSRADIVATFTEPMFPAAFDPATSFRVYNASVGRYVTGIIRASPDGLSFTFRPAFGYGKGPSNVQVTLTTALTDRSNNSLDKGITVNFVSQFDPYSPSYNELNETFTNNAYEDITYIPTYGKAEWNKSGSGILQGTFSTASLEILYSTGGLQLAHPWWVVPVRVQNVYASGVMGGTVRTIVGFVWRDAYPGTYNGTYPTVVTQIGNNNTNTVDQTGTWANSFAGTPTQVFSGSYTPPQTGEWRNGPAFTTNWSYNGTSNVVLDIDSRSNGTVQAYWRRDQNGVNVHYDSYSGTGFSTSHFDIRWLYLVDKSEAQSKWYDTGVPSPNYLSPILIQTVPAGTVVTVLYQGAKPDPLAPSNPDTNSLSLWTSNPLADLPGYRFIRFHVDMQSNLGTTTKPSLDTVTMPYIYF
jgi:hypothetical protein